MKQFHIGLSALIAAGIVAMPTPGVARDSGVAHDSYGQWAAAGTPPIPASRTEGTHTPRGALDVFSTLVDFEAAVGDPGALAFEGFDGGPTGAGAANVCAEPVNSASSDACFSPGDLVDGFSMTSTSGNGIVVLGDGIVGQVSAIIGPTMFPDSTEIAFSPAITALAFDAFSNNTDPVTVSAFDATDTLVGSADVTPADTVNGSFIGIISPIAIARIEVAGLAGAGELVDELRFGNAGGGGGNPIIGVAPGGLAASQATNTTTDQILTISNTGGSDLDWTIEETVPTIQPPAGASSDPLSHYAGWLAAGQPALPATSGAPIPNAPRGGLDVYTTLPDFQTAVADPGALVLENFDGGLTGAGAANVCAEPVNSASNDVCFAPGDLVDGFSMTSTSGNGIVVLGDGLNGQVSAIIGPTTFTDSTMIAFSPPITALAFDAFNNSTNPVAVTAYDAADVIIGTASVVPADAVNGSFIGIIGPVEIARVEIAAANDGGELIDEMYFAPGASPTGCAAPSDLPWASVDQSAGTTAPTGSTDVTVTFDSTGLAEDTYEGVLCVASNDPVTPLVEVPVSLTVTGGSSGIPGTFPTYENFDEQTAPNLPTDWLTAAAGDGVPFVTVTEFADTAPNAAYAPNLETISDMTLDTPSFTPVPGQTLTFQHQFVLESGFDGAVLEISIAGGAFQDIVAAGGSFISGGYNATISTGFASPIGGRDAWSGDSGGFVTADVELPAAAAGQPTVMRFRTADDNSTAPAAPNGWWIDTIHLDVGAPPVDPVATFNPTSFSFTVAANETATDTLNIANAADTDPLTYSIQNRETTGGPILRPHVAQSASRAVAPSLLGKGDPVVRQAVSLSGNGSFGGVATPAPWEPVGPNGAFTFQFDDGSYENAIGLGQAGPPATEAAAVWINRFEATGALTIDSISIMWPVNTGGTVVGLDANLVAYYDADADGDPGNAVRLGTDNLVTIASLDVFETYTANFSVPGAGDVYIGFVDHWALAGGYQPRLFPAAIDQDSGSQGMSYLSGAGTPPTDVDNLGNNNLTGVIDDLNPAMAGNWLIRATGTGGGGGGPCTGPIVNWLSASPANGSVNGGEDVDVTITADPSADSLVEGSYSAELCVTTNDPTQLLVAIPVDLTVTAPVAAFCDGGADTIFCGGFD